MSGVLESWPDRIMGQDHASEDFMIGPAMILSILARFFTAPPSSLARRRGKPEGRESQRDSATKPRVATKELPWENATKNHNPERVVAPTEHQHDAKTKPRQMTNSARST